MRLLGQVLRRPQFRENETGLVSELARLGIKELCLFNAAGPCISTVKNREAWFVIALLDAADNKLMLVPVCFHRDQATANDHIMVQRDHCHAREKGRARNDVFLDGDLNQRG